MPVVNRQHKVFADNVENSQTLSEFYNEFQKYRIIHGRRQGLRELPI